MADRDYRMSTPPPQRPTATPDPTREAISARVTATTTAYRLKEKQRASAKTQATAEANAWAEKYPVAATQTALRQRDAVNSEIIGERVGGSVSDEPRPCWWKMRSLDRDSSECLDDSLHYDMDDLVRDEHGRWELPDHHPANFYPAPSPTPAP